MPKRAKNDWLAHADTFLGKVAVYNGWLDTEPGTYVLVIVKRLGTVIQSGTFSNNPYAYFEWLDVEGRLNQGPLKVKKLLLL